MEWLGSQYDYGLWWAVLLNVLLFGSFVLAFLAPQRRAEWRSLSVLSAFLVALFTEMYGFPLTIYILSSVLGYRLPTPNPFNHLSGHLWATLLGAPNWAKLLICQIGSLIMIAGLIIMGKAWKQLHRAKGELVTDGLYGLMRHPQYFGLSLFVGGLLIQWPTLITLLMGPILWVMYYRLARREEEELEKRFGDRYRRYREVTPALLPAFHRSGKIRLIVKPPTLK